MPNRFYAGQKDYINELNSMEAAIVAAENAAAASAAAALVSEDNTEVSAAAALASEGVTNADVVLTHADVVLTHADVVLAEADKVQTGLDRVATNADVVLTHADVILAEADKVQTGLDRIATNADAALTNADVVLTNADVVLTHADVVSAEADKVQTGLDRVATNADVVSTGIDRAAVESLYDTFDDRYLGTKTADPTLDNDGNALIIGTIYFNSTLNHTKFYNGAAWEDPEETSTSAALTATTQANNSANSAAAALISEGLAEADKVQTGLDRVATAADKVSTNADVVLTHADVILAEADKVQTGLDRIATAADKVATNADVVLAEADKVQTGLDRIATAADVVTIANSEAGTAADLVLTNADVVLTHADVVLAEADKVQTGLDRTAVASDLVATNQDTIDTAADVVLTHADVILAEADKVQTGLDRVATGADVVLTHADVVLAEADKVQTGLDRVATNADVVITNADVVSADNARIAAQAAQAASEVALDSFDDRYLGAKASDPTLDNDGNALLTGTEYFNTVINNKKVWNGTTWQLTTANAVDVVNAPTGDIVATTVQGAINELDTEKAALAGASFTGAITTTSTIDGRDVATDGSKLDGIESLADVTDTTNVVAALSAGTGVGISAGGEISVTAVALTTVQTAVSEVAQLALTAQEGDVVVRSDENKSYVHNGGVAGTMADYTLLSTPTDSVLSVAGKTGVVDLVKGDVGLGNVDNTTDLLKPISTATQTALDGKIDDAQVLTDVPSGAIFTDTVYSDTVIQAEVDLNTAKLTNVTTDLSKTVTTTDVTINSSDGTNIAIGAASTLVAGVMTKAMYDAQVVNNAKVTNLVHPLVETAVPVGAIFIDTVYSDTAIQSEVDLNTVKTSDINHVTLELPNVDNTSDINKPVSTIQQIAIDSRAIEMAIALG
jgi:uncharacterized membrane protein